MDIINAVRMADKLQAMVKSAKFLYGEKWPERKAEWLKVVDAYMKKYNKKTRLAAAIDMAGQLDDGIQQVTLLASVVDTDG